MKRQLYDRRIVDAFAAHLHGKKAPAPPAGSEIIFNVFRALSATRSHSQGMPNPISFTEIEAHSRLYRWPLEPRHIDLLMAMDRAWLQRTHSKPGDDVARAPRMSTQAMSPEAFDAVFG